MLLLISHALAQAVAASPDYAGHCQTPIWSADGSILSWEVNYLERKSIELYVAPFSGQTGTPRKVLPASRGQSSLTEGFSTTSESVSHEIAFAPPSMGAHYVYASSGSAQDYDLYLDTGGSVSPMLGADGNAAWSPLGTQIVFTSARSGQGDLYLLDVRNPAQAPLRLTGDETASELYAAWSPDGKRLAFVGHTANGDNIYLIESLDFPAPRPITTWSHTQTRPSWSPDGKWIAFYSNHVRQDRYDLYVMRLGGTPVLVDEGVVLNPHGPVWTPDSLRVLYVKDDDGHLNPIYSASVETPTSRSAINTQTVGNMDLALTRRADDSVYIAVSALGLSNDAVRDFRRIYVMKLP